MPQPSSAGWKLSETKPSTDQVLTKQWSGLASRPAWVSRSATWTPLTPRDCISRAQPSRSLGTVGVRSEVGGEAEEGFLEEPGDHAGVGAAAGDGGGAAGIGQLLGADGLAQGVVGAVLRREREVEVVAGPGLDHGVDVEDAELAAEAHDVERAGVDREVDAEAAAVGEELGQKSPVVLGGYGGVDEADAALLEEGAVDVGGVDDGDLVGVVDEVALDQRQGALADRAEADHHDRAVYPPVARIGLGHRRPLPVDGALRLEHPRRGADKAGAGHAPRMYIAGRRRCTKHAPACTSVSDNRRPAMAAPASAGPSGATLP